MAEHRCIDCAQLPEAQSKKPRKIDKRSGPRSQRCREHYLAKRNAEKQRAIDRRGEKKYGVPSGTYEELKAIQGGVCWICGKATGEAKALSFEHDHSLARQHDHPEDHACIWCLRGLACHTCNVIILGRYSDEALLRAIEYRRNPPANILRARLGLTREEQP